MSKLFNIIESIEKVLPADLIDEHDNSGLLIGDRMQEVKHIRLALEATVEVIDSAVKDKVDLLIVHHPLIFSPMTSVTSDTLEGKKVLKLIQNGIALYAAHSNFDRATDGLNRTFGRMAGLVDVTLAEVESNGYVLKGVLHEAMTVGAYVAYISEEFNLKHIRYVGEETDQIRSVGFCTGSGMSFVSDHLFEEVDVYLTGDLKYHDAMWLHESGHKVIDVTHYGSEIIAAEVFYKLISEVLTSDIKMTKDTAIVNPIKIGS